MNPRNAINFAKSPTGAFLTFCFFMLVGFFVFQGFRSPKGGTGSGLISEASGAETKDQTVQSSRNENFTPFNPPPDEKDKPAPAQEPERNEKKQEAVEISLFADSPNLEQT